MILAYSSELVLWVRRGVVLSLRLELSCLQTEQIENMYGLGVLLLLEVRNGFLPWSALYASPVSHLDLLLDAVRPDEAHGKPVVPCCACLEGLPRVCDVRNGRGHPDSGESERRAGTKV